MLGFLLAQAVGARVARDERITWHRLFFAALAVHAIVFAVGVPWLKAASGSSGGFALSHGLWIFVPGTLIKCGLIAFAGAPLRRLSITRGWLRAGDSDRAAS